MLIHCHVYVIVTYKYFLFLCSQPFDSDSVLECFGVCVSVCVRHRTQGFTLSYILSPPIYLLVYLFIYLILKQSLAELLRMGSNLQTSCFGAPECQDCSVSHHTQFNNIFRCANIFNFGVVQCTHLFPCGCLCYLVMFQTVLSSPVS